LDYIIGTDGTRQGFTRSIGYKHATACGLRSRPSALGDGVSRRWRFSCRPCPVRGRVWNPPLRPGERPGPAGRRVPL